MEKKKVLIVVDMQNDFITGPLGNAECQAVVEKVVDKINNFDGTNLIYTLDTHEINYLDTQEGENLPVIHCIKYSDGWMLNDSVNEALSNRHIGCLIWKIEKNTFGSPRLVETLFRNGFTVSDKFEIEFVGVCTGICVISNVMLIKAYFPEARVTVDASCCACATPESHKTALEAMKLCQVNIINE